MIRPESSSARAASPSMRPSKHTSGCRLPSPAWKTLATIIPYSSASPSMASRTSGSLVRGITPSCTK